jgi:proteasome lid subunit RPN8/RPN11
MPKGNTSAEEGGGENSEPELPAQPNLPPSVRREMALMAGSAGVQEQTVSLEIEAQTGTARISFTLQTETPVLPPIADIRPEERLVFAYEDIEAIGVSAPTLVLSGRDDFPKDLGHLNPVGPGQPASLCLTRTGLQPIYDRYGIEGVMVRLRTWMRDAMTGGLMVDGWEPVPFSAAMPMRGGLLDPAAFQEIASKRRAELGWTTGVAQIPEEADHVVLNATEIDATKPPHLSALSVAVKALTNEHSHRVGVPWVFLWPADDKPIKKPVFGFWTTYRDMRDGLAEVGLTRPLEAAIGTILGNGCDCQHAPARRTLVILIGLWRPVRLAKNIFGLSNDLVARRLEIKAYTLETKLTGDLLADDTKLCGILADPMPSPALFRWTTGTPILAPAGLIGYGALGQAIADHLLRSGIEEMIAIDRDTMLAHNLARHDGEIHDLYRPKINRLERSAIALTVSIHRPQIRAFKDDAAKLSDSELADRLGGARVIIDATADERVRGRLTKFNSHDRRQIVRIEIFHHGHLGVQFVTNPSGNPSLFDLYYVLCREALTNDGVARWLYDEHVGLGADQDELLFGFGCSSRTTRLPNFVVAQHASAFMPTIVRGLTGETPPGIGLNQLGDDFRPLGWRWIDAPEFIQIEPASAPNWTIRLHPEVLAFLADERNKALPKETGGYLYGGWDTALKQVTVVAATPLPPGSTASAPLLTLGPAGNTSLEQRLTRRTGRRIWLCGTWHSHPGASAAMSEKDVATVSAFTSLDHQVGVPTLLVIVAAEGHIEVHFRG